MLESEKCASEIDRSYPEMRVISEFHRSFLECQFGLPPSFPRSAGRSSPRKGTKEPITNLFYVQILPGQRVSQRGQSIREIFGKDERGVMNLCVVINGFDFFVLPLLPINLFLADKQKI
jgi:hypothetical protein